MPLKSHFSTSSVCECGCDEAGRGCLAGPVFAAAVIFPYDYENADINDSKKLSAVKRQKLRDIIEKEAIAFSIAIVPVEKIDEINILNASILGMNQAIAQLSLKPQLLLIDGNHFTDQWHIPYHCIVKGDAAYLSIAAASILAKTYRDEFMMQLDGLYPMYHWKQNKGYPTPEHIVAIRQYGFSSWHRRSFHLKHQLKLNF